MSSIAALLPAFAGMETGRRLRPLPATFRPCFFAGFTVIGAWVIGACTLLR